MDGKRKNLLLGAALDTNTGEGTTDPRQDWSKMIYVDMHTFVSDQEILMCINKCPIRDKTEAKFFPLETEKVEELGISSGPDFQTCYFDQRQFQFPIQNTQFDLLLLLLLLLSLILFILFVWVFFGLFFFCYLGLPLTQHNINSRSHLS